MVPPQRFRAGPQQPAYCCKKGLAPEWLSEQVAVEVCGIVSDGRVRAGDEEDRDCRVVGPELTSELDSVHDRHVDVGDDQPERLIQTGGGSQRSRSVLRLDDAESGPAQHPRQKPAEEFLVVNQQDGWLLCRWVLVVSHTSDASDSLRGGMLTSVLPTSSQSNLKRGADDQVIRVFPLRMPQGDAVKVVELVEPELRLEGHP